MLFRTKYLLGIMATVFGLLYLLFGIVGLGSQVATRADQWMPFVLGIVHVALGGLLFWTSSRERHAEQARLVRLLRMVLRECPSLSAREFADLAGISPADAQEFLLWASRRQRTVVVVGSGSSLRVWPSHSLN
ncbi:MAG: hypothetical protein KatS3mg039_1363 [Candidatus Kapaibacterium sp.]|nr:MAG: hypothetical protein KatS3mg039_1363 [Candidatus Kapabacteria bacterium]